MQQNRPSKWIRPGYSPFFRGPSLKDTLKLKDCHNNVPEVGNPVPTQFPWRTFWAYRFSVSILMGSAECINSYWVLAVHEHHHLTCKSPARKRLLLVSQTQEDKSCSNNKVVVIVLAAVFATKTPISTVHDIPLSHAFNILYCYYLCFMAEKKRGEVLGKATWLPSGRAKF